MVKFGRRKLDFQCKTVDMFAECSNKQEIAFIKDTLITILERAAKQRKSEIEEWRMKKRE